MTWLAGWLDYGVIYLLLVCLTLIYFTPLPPPPSNIGLICLFTSTLPPLFIIQPRVWDPARIMLMFYWSPVSQSNISTQPSVPCSAHTASLLHLLLGLSAKLFTNWQNFWIIFHPDWEWSHIWQGWLASPISLIFRKFLLLQILINFHGVIPGVLGIFYYNWSLFHVEENIWISKIPSDTHPHPGLIWYLETYPSITV